MLGTRRPLRYLEALSVVQTVWEALNCPCAERLQPVLLDTAKLLASHCELNLTPQILEELCQVSRSTLPWRLARLPTPKSRQALPHQKPGSRLRSEVPLGRYDWDESQSELYGSTWWSTMEDSPWASLPTS